MTFVTMHLYPKIEERSFFHSAVCDIQPDTILYTFVMEFCHIVDMQFSYRYLVTSGVPQDKLLGPGLFTAFINNIDVGLEVVLSKFADSTKSGGAVDSFEDGETLLRGLENQRAGQSLTTGSLTSASATFCTWEGATLSG